MRMMAGGWMVGGEVELVEEMQEAETYITERDDAVKALKYGKVPARRGWAVDHDMPVPALEL